MKMPRGTASPAVMKLAQPAAESLIIARVNAIPVELPLTKPMFMAGVKIERTENLLVRIEARNGAVGWGEAASATVTGELLPGMVAAVERYLVPLLIGQDALQHAMLTARCAQALRHKSGTKAAVEMALLDLVGRHLRVPVSDLLGGALRDSVRPMWLLGNRTAAEDIADARRKQEDGSIFNRGSRWTLFLI